MVRPPGQAGGEIVSELWISVKEELPFGEDVLLLFIPNPNEDPPIYGIGYYNRLAASWCINGEMEHNIFPPDYWQPLPTPPNTSVAKEE